MILLGIRPWHILSSLVLLPELDDGDDTLKPARAPNHGTLSVKSDGLGSCSLRNFCCLSYFLLGMDLGGEVVLRAGLG